MNNQTEQCRVYISHPTFFVGSERDVEDLWAMGHLDAAAQRTLYACGVRKYCASSISLVDMLRRAALECLTKTAGLAPHIDAVLVATVNSMNEQEEFALKNALHDLGLKCNIFLSIQWLHCSAFSKTVDIAELMIRFQERRSVLVILGGKVANDRERFVPASGILEGDGAAAFIVSRHLKGARLMATETQTSFEAPLPTLPDTSALRGAKSFGALRALARGILDRSNISTSEIGAVVCTYGSNVYLELAAGAIGVSDDKIVRAPLERYGHVFSCDSIIGIATYEEERLLQERGYLLVIGWSQHIRGATLLKWP